MADIDISSLSVASAQDALRRGDPDSVQGRIFGAIKRMEALRKEVDYLEGITDHDYWPVPTYNDILFYA